MTASQLNHSRPETGTRSCKRLLAACVLVVGCASLLASLIQNSWGRVQVMDVKIPTQNGQWLVADLYRPKTASSDHPAPLVVVVPGFQRSKEALGNISLELARTFLFALTLFLSFFLQLFAVYYFFRLTGRIYLGPMTTCLAFITIRLSNTVSYTPL